MPTVKMRIAIVGGGLGGLAAALFLEKAGLDATVYEQASELREVGAGIVVSPNMARPLGQLGLADKLPGFAVRLEAAWEFRRWKDGRVLSVQSMGEECERLYGAPATSLTGATCWPCSSEPSPTECFAWTTVASNSVRASAKWNSRS